MHPSFLISSDSGFLLTLAADALYCACMSLPLCSCQEAIMINSHSCSAGKVFTSAECKSKLAGVHAKEKHAGGSEVGGIQAAAMPNSCPTAGNTVEGDSPR